MIQVIEGKDVDVIEPFPVGQLDHVVRWMHNFKSLVLDDMPDEEMLMFLGEQVKRMRTWGIIDKANLTKSKVVEVPIVGIIFFEKINPYNGYFHVASNRKAWGEKLAKPGMVEQAGRLVIDEIFKTDQDLMRVSAAMVSTNLAAVNLAKRLGFVKDGYFARAAMQSGKPKDVMHFGILRPGE
jgi:RimJ/RimL family protein N-acetyltransferase